MDDWYWVISMVFVPGENEMGVARGGGMVTYRLLLFPIMHHIYLITITC